MRKIALDPGHGLYTEGKQTPDGIKEWTLNDIVRDKVVKYLEPYNVLIIHTDYDEGITDESLSSRVALYKSKGAEVVVSIHHNAHIGNWNSVTGIEVYTDKNPTEADIKLAQAIYNRMVEYMPLKPRGIKQANFTIINQNSIPAVLCEGGFMDGTNDYKYITSEEGQSAYAKAIAEGLIEFLDLKKKEDDKEMSTECKFKDIKGHFAENDIKDLFKMGIINGISEAEFAPNKTATRGEIAVIARNVIRYIVGK